jgi:GH43 family beta-xylosidase
MGEINHRMCVISGDDPMKSFGNFTNMGDNNNGDSAIDQTVFEYKGKLYTCYAGRTDGCLRLMMAEMASPTEIKPKRVIISEPEYDWETHVDHTNEGPFVLERNGKLYIVYSASGAAFDEYCLGILKFKGGKVTDPANWEKHPVPIMTGQGNLLGTGHCTFTTDADGEVWCAFHINKPRTAEQYGTWVNRYLCLQPVIWIDDFPHFSPMVEKPKYFKYEK